MNAGRYQLHANNRAVAIPKSLSRTCSGVTGLDNAAPRLPLMRAARHRTGTAGQPKVACSQYYGQHHLAGLPRQFGRTSFPTQICGYKADQMRAAYGMNMGNNGQRPDGRRWSSWA